MQITRENIEELILLYVDKELDENTAAALLLYLQQHPEYRDVLEAYQDTVLQPETNIIFEAKESLKKTIGNSVPFNAPKPRLKMAWAAVVILLLGTALFTLLLIHNRDQNDMINPTITIHPKLQPQHILPVDTPGMSVNNTIPDQSNNTVAKKDNIVRQPVKKIHNITPNNTTTIKSILPDDNAMKDTIAVAHILPGKIKVHVPEPVDSTASPAVVQTNPIRKVEEVPELAVNDDHEAPSSKGLLPGVINVAGKIFNHKRKTTQLKINIGNNKEYILSFNY